MVEKTRCVPVCNKSPMCNRYLTPTIATSSAVQVRPPETVRAAGARLPRRRL